MSKALPTILGLLLVGCPSPINERPVETTASPALPVLASCEILQDWQREGQESWYKAIKNPDGTYTLCGEPFHRGAVEGECILPPIGDAVMVEGQTEDYPHHRVAEQWCLDAINGGVAGQCENGWNCQDVWDKAGNSSGCTAIPARRAGTCEAMWGVQPEQQEPEQVCPVDQFKDCMTCYVRNRFLCDGLKPENVNNLVFKRARRACLHGEDFVTNYRGTPHRCAEHHLDHESELTQRCAVLWSTQGFRDAWREELQCR